MPTLGQDLVRLRTLKKTYDKAKKLSDTAERKYKDWQYACLQRMEAEESEGQRTRGTLFTPVQTEYASVQDRSVFVAWAKENAPDLVEEKERAKLLNALVREALDNQQELPPGVGFYTRDYISMRES